MNGGIFRKVMIRLMFDARLFWIAVVCIVTDVDTMLIVDIVATQIIWHLMNRIKSTFSAENQSLCVLCVVWRQNYTAVHFQIVWYVLHKFVSIFAANCCKIDRQQSICIYSRAHSVSHVEKLETLSLCQRWNSVNERKYVMNEKVCKFSRRMNIIIKYGLLNTCRIVV